MPTKSNNTGARRKKTAVKEKVDNENPGDRKLEVLNIPEIEGVEMPKPHDFLLAEQRDGSAVSCRALISTRKPGSG